MSNRQAFVFDKFMKDIEEKQNDADERRKILEKQESEWQSRHLLRRYREHPLNLRGVEKK